MIGHRRSVLQCAAIFKVGGDSRRSKRVISDQCLEACCQGPPAHHGMRIGLWQNGRAQLPGTALDRAKQRPFRIAVDPGLHQVRVQVTTKRKALRQLVRVLLNAL